MNPKFVEGLRWLQNEFPGHEVTVHYTPPNKMMGRPWLKREAAKTKEEKMNTTSFLSVSIEVAGAHNYPESTRVYLKHSHRHDFRVSVVIGVTDQNRQFEFYDVQDSLRAALDSLFVKIDNSTYNFGTRSCEHIANELFPVLCKEFPVESVSVFEDDYNGSTVVKDHKVSFYNSVYNKSGKDFRDGGLVHDFIYKGENGKGLIIPPGDE